jgi:hypothetical protein
LQTLQKLSQLVDDDEHESSLGLQQLESLLGPSFVHLHEPF